MQDSAADPLFEPRPMRTGATVRRSGSPRSGDRMSGPLRAIGRGLALLVGIAWILVSMLIAGFAAGLSSAGRDLTDKHSTIGAGAGHVVLGCGLVLIVLFVVAIVKRRYGVASFATLVPAVAFYVVATGGSNNADFFGSVPSLDAAVTATVITAACTVAIFVALFLTGPGGRAVSPPTPGDPPSPRT